MNINRGPARIFTCHDIEEGVLHFRQPYVRPTGFFNKVPKLFSSVASRTNKGGLVMSLWSIVLSPVNGCNVCFT